jgi:anti-sigma regulatory factor (Ser/Thr protein kinase)
MVDRFEVVVETGRGTGFMLDQSSARDLDFFLAHVRPPVDAPVERRVVAWRDNTRTVVDVTAFVSDDGVWRIAFGHEHSDRAAPDQPERVDPRLEELSTMVWMTDVDRLARWFNSAWCRFVGSELADELGWGWMRHVHPDDLVGLLEAYEDGHVGEHGFDHIARIKDTTGEYCWVRVRALPRLLDGMFDGFIGICAPEHGAAVTRADPRAALPRLLPPTDEPASAVVEHLQHLEAALQVSRPAETIEMACLRRIAAGWASQHRGLDERRDDIVLAVGEAAANSVLHAYVQSSGPVRLECALDELAAEFRVRDWGVWLPPSPTRDSRGIDLMRQLCDGFVLRHLADGTEVVLRYEMTAPSHLTPNG